MARRSGGGGGGGGGAGAAAPAAVLAAATSVVYMITRNFMSNPALGRRPGAPCVKLGVKTWANRRPGATVSNACQIWRTPCAPLSPPAYGFAPRPLRTSPFSVLEFDAYARRPNGAARRAAIEWRCGRVRQPNGAAGRAAAEWRCVVVCMYSTQRVSAHSRLGRLRAKGAATPLPRPVEVGDRRFSVCASREGLRHGDRLVPRAAGSASWHQFEPGA